jgi:hypothetical protein
VQVFAGLRRHRDKKSCQVSRFSVAPLHPVASAARRKNVHSEFSVSWAYGLEWLDASGGIIVVLDASRSMESK